MRRRLFVTTALPYANGPFHIGHIMEYIQADIWVRFQRMQGHEAHFVGADEVRFVALHALEPHPDVRLDVLHDVADVERAVRVGQGGGDEQPAAHADFQKPSFYRLAPRVGRAAGGAQTRAITVAMTTAAPTVAAMITFSRCPQGRSS